MEEYTPTEALSILNQATGHVPLIRTEHIKIQDAVTILDKFIKDHSKAEETKT